MSLVESVLRAEPQKFGLWPSVWKLLRLRVRIWWNAFRRSKTRSKVGTIIVLTLILGFMVFLFFASALLLRFLRSPQLAQLIDPTQLLNAIPTLILTGAFVVTIMTNFGVLLQSLYLSQDMDFLVTTPLPMRAVFLAKLLEAILPNFALFCAFSLPVLFGLGISSGFNVLYYPLLIAMLALLALAAGGLASILVMAVVRVVPARRVAEVLGFLGAIVSILCGQSGNLANSLGLNRQDVSNTLNTFTRLNTPWSPLAWAGRGLVAIGHNQWLAGLGLTALSLLLAGAIFAGTLFLAEQLYYTGWASMQGSVRRKKPVRKTAAPRAAVPPVIAPQEHPGAAAPRALNLPSILPRPVRGLILKDLLVLRRDPRNLSQLITPLILGFVFLFTTRTGMREGAQYLDGSGLQNLEVYGLTFLAVFVGWMLMFNLASLAFTREGRNYWLLKSAPVRPWQLLAAKFIISFVPSALFSLVYLVLAFLIRGMSWLYFPYVALVVCGSIAGATGLALAFGTVGANLEWDSPNRQRLRGGAGCLGMIVVGAFMLIDVLLYLSPPIAWALIGTIRGGGPDVLASAQPPLLTYILGVLLGSAAALAGAIIPLIIVKPRLAQIGEN